MATFERVNASFTTDLLTYQDIIEHLQTFLGGDSTGRGFRDIRQAIQTAYREITHEHRWTYLFAKHRIITDADYSTGTITYTHSTRTLTLATGTWPTWAKFGHVRISNKAHRVERRVDGADLILDPVNNPGDDIAAGTSYSIGRAVYPLPGDFVAMSPLVSENLTWLGTYIRPAEWLSLDRYDSNVGRPYRYTIMQNPDIMGQLALFLYPTPDTLRTEDLIYIRRPRPLRISGKESDHAVGTLGLTADSAAATGTSTVFDSSMVGSIVRAGTSTKAPTGVVGTNPYKEQQVIQSVTSATAVTLSSVAEGTRAGVKYTISDPVDIDPVMIDAFLRCCEKQLAIIRQMKRLDMIAAAYLDALESAKAGDQRVQERRYVGSGATTIRRLADIPLDADP